MNCFVQQKILAAVLFCFMPVSELSQDDSMQNMISRSFLISLWWKELTCLAVLLCLVLLVTARLALRNGGPQRAENDPIPTDVAEKLKELTK